MASSGPITSHVGSWTPSVSLADGTYTVTATSVDSFGEVGSTTSTPITFTVDDTPPAAPTFTSPAAGATLTSGTPTVTLQTDAGDLVVLCVDDPNNNDCDSVRADANGVATFKVGDYTQNTGGTTALTSGQHKLEAWSYDELYNQSAESSIAIDVKPPTTTTTTTTTPTSPTRTATTPAPTATTPTSTPAATVPSAQEVASALNRALGGISGKSATTAAVVKAGGATLSFKAPSAGTVKVAWYGEVKGKKTLIGSGTKTIGAGGTAKVKVKLDAAGKKLLKGAHGSVKVTQSGSFTPTGGKQHTTSKTLKLKG